MQNKIKIGARKLSENEIKLILPTYENILGQINAIRNSKEEKSSNNNEEKEQSGVEEDFLQKTNNIGIMGCRGWIIVNKVDRKNENSTYWGQASTRLLGFGASSPKVFI